MPTFETLPQFEAGWRTLTREQQTMFRKVVLEVFTPGLMTSGRSFRPELQVRPIPDLPGLFEMSWGGEGRAAFAYGAERMPGEPHVIWHQIATFSNRLPAPGR
jgi:hypothetical protein